MEVIPVLVGARVGLLILCVAVGSAHIRQWRGGDTIARWRWSGDLFFVVTTGLLWTPVSLANVYVPGFTNPPVLRLAGTYGYVGTILCWAVAYALTNGGGARGAKLVTLMFGGIVVLTTVGAFLWGAPQ